jgi:hypothetical protein
METIIAFFEVSRRLAKAFGPYLLLEIVLPGGTLFALLLFVARRLYAKRAAESAIPQ